jgi:phosphoribosyl 1,2-cyclic phosphate phosphodiesterase
MPVFGTAYMMQNIETRFDYTTFPPGKTWETPSLQTTAVDGPFCHRGVTVTPIPLMHGKGSILGYRIGGIAYLTDVSEIPEASFALLDGLEVLLLDCLRDVPHPTHFSVEQAIEAAKRIGARNTVFIHMTHDLEYHALSARLPAGMVVAYDGMRLQADAM